MGEQQWEFQCDYVIVGAGSAGCVLANRLSADPKNRVVLIEAGGRDNYHWIHIPVGYFKTMNNPRTDWCYYTQPDPGLNGRQNFWPRGRTLGGSSSINGLLYVRGQAQDYDHWRQLGNVGWGWEDVLPLFKRSENWAMYGRTAQDDELRGNGGLLSVEETPIRYPITDAWMKACENAGYPPNPDYNGQTQEGVAAYQQTIRGGQRCSAAVAFLNPVKHRKNLHIITDTMVDRIIFDGKRAVGVNARNAHGPFAIGANLEVIVASGAINSPQLLMLSGIGDGQHLQDHGIDLVHERKGVGQNLQDHLQARPMFKTNMTTINTEINNWWKQALIGMQYMLNRSGRLTLAASLCAGFMRTKKSLETPDIQFHVQPLSADTLVEGPHAFSGFTTSVCQLRPESVGSLSLKSPCARDYPNIVANYLDTDTDRATMIAGVRIAHRIANTEPLKSLITDVYYGGEPAHGDDDASILEWIRNTATTIYHPCGTCKMGTDDMSVVNPRLQVHGIKSLRVVDASIMPAIVSGNTNAPTIMIAQNAADMILQDNSG